MQCVVISHTNGHLDYGQELLRSNRVTKFECMICLWILVCADKLRLCFRVSLFHNSAVIVFPSHLKDPHEKFLCMTIYMYPAQKILFLWVANTVLIVLSSSQYGAYIVSFTNCVVYMNSMVKYCKGDQGRNHNVYYALHMPPFKWCCCLQSVCKCKKGGRMDMISLALCLLTIFTFFTWQIYIILWVFTTFVQPG